ncbi:hypothetical protein [Amycolatopsis tucumanensis]|uniref:hypothetical protein n=1 Tax=Amycolatopsis tucumanensis TaxID=401106 RepID=UPI001F23B891|nr:hypothetical protein [Amycolatopsis tucumanensis]MCF6425464.1 hypothetical protein [Amycolatopsis tucumanensis]
MTRQPVDFPELPESAFTFECFQVDIALEIGQVDFGLAKKGIPAIDFGASDLSKVFSTAPWNSSTGRMPSSGKCTFERDCRTNDPREFCSTELIGDPRRAGWR